MSLEARQSQWKWITDVAAGHLVILLYSFLEKTLKYIYRWFIERKIITLKYNKKNPKIYFWLYNIFEMDEEAFREKYSEIYDILDECRKVRNHFAHDNLEGVGESDEDYVYEERELQKSFRLVDFITVISSILYEIEEIYKKEWCRTLILYDYMGAAGVFVPKRIWTNGCAKPGGICQSCRQRGNATG